MTRLKIAKPYDATHRYQITRKYPDEELAEKIRRLFKKIKPIP